MFNILFSIRKSHIYVCAAIIQTFNMHIYAVSNQACLFCTKHFICTNKRCKHLHSEVSKKEYPKQSITPSSPKIYEAN